MRTIDRREVPVIHLLAMTTVRGKVIGSNRIQWTLLIHVVEIGGVVEAEWPAEPYIDMGATVGINTDGALTYPVDSCSMYEGLEDVAPRGMRLMTIPQLFHDIASERKTSIEAFHDFWRSVTTKKKP